MLGQDIILRLLLCVISDCSIRVFIVDSCILTVPLLT